MKRREVKIREGRSRKASRDELVEAGVERNPGPNFLGLVVDLPPTKQLPLGIWVFPGSPAPRRAIRGRPYEWGGGDTSHSWRAGREGGRRIWHHRADAGKTMFDIIHLGQHWTVVVDMLLLRGGVERNPGPFDGPLKPASECVYWRTNCDVVVVDQVVKRPNQKTIIIHEVLCAECRNVAVEVMGQHFHKGFKTVTDSVAAMMTPTVGGKDTPRASSPADKAARPITCVVEMQAGTSASAKAPSPVPDCSTTTAHKDVAAPLPATPGKSASAGKSAPGIEIECSQCKSGFLFSFGEADYYAKHQLTVPKRCPGCRKAAKTAKAQSTSPSVTVPPSGASTPDRSPSPPPSTPAPSGGNPPAPNPPMDPIVPVCPVVVPICEKGLLDGRRVTRHEAGALATRLGMELRGVQMEQIEFVNEARIVTNRNVKLTKSSVAVQRIEMRPALNLFLVNLLAIGAFVPVQTSFLSVVLTLFCAPVLVMAYAHGMKRSVRWTVTAMAGTSAAFVISCVLETTPWQFVCCAVFTTLLGCLPSYWRRLSFFVVILSVLLTFCYQVCATEMRNWDHQEVLRGRRQSATHIAGYASRLFSRLTEDSEITEAQILIDERREWVRKVTVMGACLLRCSLSLVLLYSSFILHRYRYACMVGKMKVVYSCPHIVACVLAEYAAGTSAEVVATNTRSKMMRLATLPIPDDAITYLLDGSELAIKVIAEGSSFFAEGATFLTSPL